ncbi:MAG: hypothetical protein WA885_16775 [Phormidesmis sp.]
MLIATGGLVLNAQNVRAQTAANINYNSATGVVQIDNNAFNIRTGELNNTSNIPLPALLPAKTQEGEAQPISPTRLAPNSVEIRPNVDYINQSFNDILGERSGGATYLLRPESLQLRTQFDLGHREFSHAYGEGIQVTVFGADNNIKLRESAFVRGDVVTVGPDGQPLAGAERVNVSYSGTDSVELRVLNIRTDGAEASQSGIYFSERGEFIVEDLQNGGDLDFDDGDYIEFSGGQGEALTIKENSRVSVVDEVVETPLAPETRLEEIVAADIIETIQESDTAFKEERDWGSIEAPDIISTLLGHATGVSTAAGEQLVYNRYANASQIRAGSDGIGITGQLAPLVDNPNVPPTLLSGNLTFNPTVGDNEAGLTGTFRITQFLNSTHRQATDMFGNPIENPEADGSRLVEPAGLFNNRCLVGYVPSTPDQTVLGSQISSTNGIFDLPANQAVVIEPSDPTTVGRGNAAYTHNVGGLLIEANDGAISFVPQWTGAGYAQESLSLKAGEAQRIIYALVPQQAGQNLQIGQTYPVVEDANGYKIADGDFTIISADRQPQNFVQETVEVYAVEDTMPGDNTATAEFNGIPGFYAESVGGDRKLTVDVSLADEVDARVGNTLYPLETIAGEVGQQAYGKTTVAAGFYLGGSFTGGVGNQRDTVRRTSATIEVVADELRIQRTLNTFVTPLIQKDIVQFESTETIRQSGTAVFDIDRDGKLTNVEFIESIASAPIVERTELSRISRFERGEEILVDSVTTKTLQPLATRLVESDQETTARSDSYPNFSSLQGELSLGGVLNFGNTPWTAAANTLSAELFARDTVAGRGGSSPVGLRAEVIFHPFGEVQRAAYQYDAAGNAIALYQTEPVLDANGNQVMTALTAGGKSVDLPVNQFALDEDGNRIAQMVGTGRAQGPGFYLRLEDVLSDDEGLEVAGGIQFSF